MKVPRVRHTVPFLCEEADMNLPVYPNGYAHYHTDCTCLHRQPGRTMINGVWVIVCMRCGSLRDGTGT
jgi:hypothetical protein